MKNTHPTDPQQPADELRDKLYDTAFSTGADSETGERTYAFVESELVEAIQEWHTTQAKAVAEAEKFNYELGYRTAVNDLTMNNHVAEAEQRGFKKGQRVGQYQAADKLYQTIPSIWLFKDSKYPDQLKMNLERTDELLKDCEKFLNHNAKVYKQYVAELQQSPHQQSDRTSKKNLQVVDNSPQQQGGQ